MIKQKYSARIYSILVELIKPTPRVFIFGSALRSNTFADVDVGLLGESISDSDIYRTKEEFEESTLPYKVDLVNFSTADKDFKKEVLNGEIKWLT